MQFQCLFYLTMRIANAQIKSDDEHVNECHLHIVNTVVHNQKSDERLLISHS